MSNLPKPSRNPLASRAVAALRGGDDDPWTGMETDVARTYALIGLTDELRRANQISLATAVGDTAMLAALGESLGVAAQEEKLPEAA